jgi:acetyltransferase-like isoleucine patch superfamily enzyme
MINFFSSGVKYILLKILGKNIKMNGIPVVDIRAEIKAHSGEIMLGHKMSTRSNVHIRAFDGGNISIGDLVFFNYNCVVSSSNSRPNYI